MKKILALVLVVSLALTCVFANGGSENAASEIKIGFIGPLTGDYANYGTRCRQSVEMAIEAKNAAGGINGSQVKLIAEDSEGDSQKALAAFEKLSSSDKVCAIIGPVLTGETFAVAEQAQAQGVLICSPSASHADITNTGDYIFRTMVSDGLQGEVAGKYFRQVLGYSNLAVLYAKNDYSQGLYEGMTKSFEEAGGKVTATENFQVGDKDFKTQLTKLKNSGIEAIYIPDYTAEMAQILEQAYQLGITVPFLSCDGFSNPEIYDLAGAYTDGVIYLGPEEIEETVALKDFQSAYAKRWNMDPDSFATNAYDGINILLSVIEKVGTDRKAIRDGFAAVKDYVGANGTINFAPNGDIIANQGVYKVEGTTPVYVGAFKVVDGKIIEAK